MNGFAPDEWHVQFSWRTLYAVEKKCSPRRQEKDKATCSLNWLISFISASQCRFSLRHWHRLALLNVSKHITSMSVTCRIVFVITFFLYPDSLMKMKGRFHDFWTTGEEKLSNSHQANSQVTDVLTAVLKLSIALQWCDAKNGKSHYRDVIVKTVMLLSDWVSRHLNSFYTCLQGSIKEGGLQLQVWDILPWDPSGVIHICHTLQSFGSKSSHNNSMIWKKRLYLLWKNGKRK